MPLNDNYETEKRLKEFTTEVARAITDSFVEEGVNSTRYFILFVIDAKTGLLQYISDMPREKAQAAMKAHIARDVQ